MAKKKAKRVKPQRVESTVSALVSDAFDLAEELRSELESWHGNLPEAFQNGSKGEALQTAMDAIEAAQRIDDVHARVADNKVSYMPLKRRASRADRLAQCREFLEIAASEAETAASDLEDMKYDEETGERNEDDKVNYPDAPDTEEERDTLVDELRNFISECNDAVAEWENVEFPGMYG